MTDQIHKELALELAPDLALEAAERYFEQRGGPQPAWDAYRRVFSMVAPELLEVPPEQWTRREQASQRGLGFAATTEEARMVSGILFTGMAALMKCIDPGYPPTRQNLLEAVKVFGQRFSLSEGAIDALGNTLLRVSQSLTSEYIAYIHSADVFRSVQGMTIPEKERLRTTARAKCDVFLDDTTGEVLVKTGPVAIPVGSYDYDILVLLMQKAPEHCELVPISQKLTSIHGVFRGRPDSPDTAERIKTQWTTLLGNLRRRDETLRRGIIYEDRRTSISPEVSTCLILAWDSRFL